MAQHTLEFWPLDWLGYHDAMMETPKFGVAEHGVVVAGRMESYGGG